MRRPGLRSTAAALPLVALLAGCQGGSGEPTAAFPPAPEFPPDHRYTLDDLAELAIHRNASLDVARYEAEAARGLVDQVNSLFLPSVRYNFAALAFDDDLNYEARAFDIATLNVPVTGNYNFVNSLTIAQIVSTGGKRTSGLKQAKMFAEIKRLEVLRQQGVVIQNVATYYHLVELTNELDAILDDTTRRARVFRQVAEDLNARGSLRVSRLDALQSDFFVEQLEQIRIAVQAGRQQAYAALRQAVGVSREEELRLRAEALPPPATPGELLSAYAAVARGFVARPETRQVDLFAHLRAEQTRFAKAAWAPNLVLLGNITDIQGNNNTILGAIDGLIASFIVDIPLYDPVRRGRLREALGMEYAAEAFQRQVEELITLEIEVLAIECQRAMATLLRTQRTRQIAAEHYLATRQAFARDLVPASDMVVALAFDMVAKVQHTQAVFAYLEGKSRLRRATADREAKFGY